MAEAACNESESDRDENNDGAGKTLSAFSVAYDVSPDMMTFLQADPRSLQVFNAEWDDEGVYFYQAFKSEIADYAVGTGRFGGAAWKPTRMTWIKPSFGWMLYRCGYGRKPGQERVLRVKLAHAVVAKLIAKCKLAETNKDLKSGDGAKQRKGKQPCEHDSEDEIEDSSSGMLRSGGRGGRIQWDPERDLFEPGAFRGKREPRRMDRTRAIQIGLSGGLSESYVANVLSIDDVTELAHAVGTAHHETNQQKCRAVVAALGDRLPNERPYMPGLAVHDLMRLGFLSREVDEWRKCKIDADILN